MEIEGGSAWWRCPCGMRLGLSREELLVGVMVRMEIEGGGVHGGAVPAGCAWVEQGLIYWLGEGFKGA
ncbi:hypothetical protein J22TS3_28450 [Paenibacillus sp. J22TS3]|nr:hypothetical protein J22TS3_28450 [Paenibacillus sp. J22TS3]